MVFRHLKKRHLLFMETIMLSWKFLRPITLVRAPMFLVIFMICDFKKLLYCLSINMYTYRIRRFLLVHYVTSDNDFRHYYLCKHLDPLSSMTFFMNPVYFHFSPFNFLHNDILPMILPV